MEAEDISKNEDRVEDPHCKNKDQPHVAQPKELSPEGQFPSPMALWEKLEKRFLEYKELTHRNPSESQKNLLSLLPLFLKVGILIIKTIENDAVLLDHWKWQLMHLDIRLFPWKECDSS